MPAGVSARLSVMLTASGGQTLPAHAPHSAFNHWLTFFWLTLFISFYGIWWWAPRGANGHILFFSLDLYFSRFWVHCSVTSVFWQIQEKRIVCSCPSFSLIVKTKVMKVTEPSSRRVSSWPGQAWTNATVISSSPRPHFEDDLSPPWLTCLPEEAQGGQKKPTPGSGPCPWSLRMAGAREGRSTGLDGRHGEPPTSCHFPESTAPGLPSPCSLPPPPLCI